MVTTANPMIFVICGPSGTGKSTLLKRILQNYPELVAFSVSHTSRARRVGEVDGKDYHFAEKQEILKSISNGTYFEYVEFSGNVYGISRDAVEQVLNGGRHCILDFDMEGVKFMQTLKMTTGIKYILILPPSLEDLKKRLLQRATETDLQMENRLMIAKRDLNYVNSIEGSRLFDVRITNAVMEVAYQELVKYILSFN